LQEGKYGGFRPPLEPLSIKNRSSRSVSFSLHPPFRKFPLPILPGATKAEGARVAERIKRSFGTTPHQQKIKRSIGLVEFGPQCDLTNFVMRTDEAMYTAPKMGRNEIYLLSKGWQLDLGVGKGFEDSGFKGSSVCISRDRIPTLSTATNITTSTMVIPFLVPSKLNISPS
jgi:hypothetical protein